MHHRHRVILTTIGRAFVSDCLRGSPVCFFHARVVSVVMHALIVKAIADRFVRTDENALILFIW